MSALLVLFLALLETLCYLSSAEGVFANNGTNATEPPPGSTEVQFLDFLKDTTLQATERVSTPKVLNASSLLYVPVKPYLTVLTKNLAKDDRVALDVSIVYERHVVCKWYLNGFPFRDYDIAWTRDIETFQANNKTYHIRLCHMEVMHLLKLPTTTGGYHFACSMAVDDTLRIVSHQLQLPVTDSCPPAKCSHRNAVCRSGKCVCDPGYPVRLDSVHTTCRRRSFLGERCTYDSQCVYTDKNSECVDKGWCACKVGYGKNQWRQCTPKYGLDARCDSDRECQKVNGSCILSHCSCVAPAVQEDTVCMDAAEWFDKYSRATPRSQACAAMVCTVCASLLVTLYFGVLH